jgi:hypothetical protein
MEINLTQDLCRAIGVKDLKSYGINEDAWKWERGTQVNIARFSRAKVLDLRNLIEPFSGMNGAQLKDKVKGAALAYRDISIWLEAFKDAASGRPRTVQQFYSMLKKFLLKEAPGQRLYYRDEQRECWWCYYVGKVEYHREYTDRGSVYPAHCDLDLYWYEFGRLCTEEVRFFEDDIRNRSIAQALAFKNYVAETPETKAIYDDSVVRYNGCADKVGLQFWARGDATDDLDGNKKRRDGGWWSTRINTITMDKGGEPSRVVIDLFRESEKQEREREVHMTARFWHYEGRTTVTSSGDEEDEDEVEALDMEEDYVPPEVPLHPTVAVFDLRRHTRLRLHMDQLTPYVYDTKLGDKLVLPPEERDLINILLANTTAFVDIVKGKGAGAVVLCVGLPGLGKTLTAQVYAEVTQRPLFSVQCSQLGTDTDELEDELLKTFARAERWNAILLLDEADVYIAPRGQDLVQNAIVGVFLRTLEYYKGIMFMTSNREDLIDDAIASRCVARLNYAVPDAKDQLRIWNILGSLSGGVINEAEARKVVKEYPQLSGRDVFNLLKLGIMVMQSRRETKVTFETIKFVKQFKPTIDIEVPFNDH